MRVSYIGITLASQAREAGSTPATRSKTSGGNMFKLIRSAIVVIAIVVIGAVAWADLYFNPNDYHAEIIDLVQEHTGYELTIDGDISLDLSELLSSGVVLRSGQLTLRNRSDIDDKTSYPIVIDTLLLKVELIPLISKLVVINRIYATLYQGEYSGNGTIDLRGKSPEFDFTEEVKRVEIEQLVQVFTGYDLLKGRVSAAGVGTAAGNSAEEMAASMSGKVSLEISDGALKGINIDRLVRQVGALFDGSGIPNLSSEPNETEFIDLTISAIIESGRAVSDDLLIITPLLRVRGEGWVDFKQKQVEYKLIAEVVGEVDGEQIPILISGELENPKIRVDIDKSLEHKVRNRVERKVKEKLNDLLKSDLFNKILK